VLRGGYAGETRPRFAIEWNKDKKLFDMNRDDITNRQNIVLFLQNIFVHTLQVRSKDCRVLIVESFSSGRRLRNVFAEVLLKDLQVVAITLQPDLSMSALASGYKYAIILDIGARDCKAVAYADGCVILSTYTACFCGISAARDVFRRRLNSIMSKIFSPEVCDLLFDRVSGFSSEEVVQLPASGLLNMKEITDVNCILNEPSVLPSEFVNKSLLATTKGVSAFESEVHIDDLGGAAGVLLSCLKKCPVDIRRFLSSRVVIVGGGANIEGLIDRIMADVIELTKDASIFPEYATMAPSIVDATAVPLHFRRSDMAWTGGSMFAAEKGLNEKHFINLATLQAIEERDKSTEASGAEGTKISVSATRLPDWQSSDSKDWTFFSPLPINTSSS
jgi:hypothetical protein